LNDVGGNLPNMSKSEADAFIFWSVLKKLGYTFDIKKYKENLLNNVILPNTLIEYQGIFYRVTDSFPTNFIGEDFFLGVGLKMELLQRGSIQFKSEQTSNTFLLFGCLPNLPVSPIDSDKLEVLNRKLYRVDSFKEPFQDKVDLRFVDNEYFVLIYDANKITNPLTSINIEFLGVSGIVLNNVNLSNVGGVSLGMIHSVSPITSDKLTIKIKI
jgi:hypothetical protein